MAFQALLHAQQYEFDTRYELQFLHRGRIFINVFGTPVTGVA
jgi:hypothetical protein